MNFTYAYQGGLKAVYKLRTMVYRSPTSSTVDLAFPLSGPQALGFVHAKFQRALPVAPVQ